MGNYPKKEIGTIEREIKRINKEEERRKAELRSKKAGGGIESFEIKRKRKIINSIINRVRLNLNSIYEMLHEELKFLDEFANKKGKEKNKEEIKSFYKLMNFIATDNYSSYISIKKDLRHTFKNGGKVDELFQDIIIKIPIDYEDDANLFFSIVRQELDLLEYLNRFR